MKLLTESANYQILYEYEHVFLRARKTSRLVNIGDFYGEPQVAIISESEDFCAVGGCGIIVYFIKEPFEEYKCHTENAQWREWKRSDAAGIVWVDDIRHIDEYRIEVLTEDGRKIELNVNAGW